MADAVPSPDLSGEPGWEPLQLTALLTDRRSFISGDPDGDRLRVRYYHRPGDGRVVMKAWFGPGAEGPPHHAHGGSIAAVLDELMGVATWFAGHHAVAGRLCADFRALLPLNIVVLGEAWVDDVQAKKIFTRGVLTGADGAVYAEAEGLFVHVGLDRIAGLLDR